LLPSEQRYKRIDISARSDITGIVIVIEDNGVGFVPKAPSVDGHTSMGHSITNKRIELYNSSFSDHINWRIEPMTDVNGNLSGTRVELIIRIDACSFDRREPAIPLIV